VQGLAVEVALPRIPFAERGSLLQSERAPRSANILQWRLWFDKVMLRQLFVVDKKKIARRSFANEAANASFSWHTPHISILS
jgi:hypothetical protein